MRYHSVSVIIADTSPFGMPSIETVSNEWRLVYAHTLEPCRKIAAWIPRTKIFRCGPSKCQFFLAGKPMPRVHLSHSLSQACPRALVHATAHTSVRAHLCTCPPVHLCLRTCLYTRRTRFPVLCAALGRRRRAVGDGRPDGAIGARRGGGRGSHWFARGGDSREAAASYCIA